MPPRSAVILLLVAACPISASVIVVTVLPARALIFHGSAAAQLLLETYFVLPALFAALVSLGIRRMVARIEPQGLFAAGALGFAAFGLMDGLNDSNAILAFTMRAGVGASSAFLMTGFNRLAMLRYDTAVSTWLLTYLNLATSAYGLAIALIAGQLTEVSASAPFLLFGLPALGLAAYLAAPQVLVATSGPAAAAESRIPPGGTLPPLPMALIVVGHMAIHVLFYLQLAQSKITIAGHALGSGQATAIYILGHVFGALLFKPLTRRLASTRRHLVVALAACLTSTTGLALSNGSAAFFLLGGLSLSHVLPLIFASIRDGVPADCMARKIADAVASGFLGQFLAPFLLQALKAVFGDGLTPAAVAAVVSVLLLGVAVPIRANLGQLPKAT